MSGRWKEVVRLTFKGERFHDHALDLTALAELGQFQKMVAETAKALWKAENPERERLPKHFETRTRLCLRRIEAGSAITPLEVYVEEPEQTSLDFFEPEPTEIEEAIALANEVFRALEHDKPFPERFPKGLVSEYAKWGEELSEDEAIEILSNGGEPTQVTRRSRSQWANFQETTHESFTEIIGEVLEADVRQKRFQVWVNNKTGVTATFSPEQEEKVTSALHDHRTQRVRVLGKGEFSPQGKPLKITQVEQLELLGPEERSYDAAARPIEDVLAGLAGEVPEEEWRRLPADLSDNLDYYLYGRPRR